MNEDDLPVEGADEPAVATGEATEKNDKPAGAKAQPAADAEETDAEADEADNEAEDEGGDPDEGDDEDADSEDEPKPRKRRSSAARARARMERLIAQNAALEERLAGMAAQQSKREERAQTDTDPKPDESKFDDPFVYQSELSAWRARQDFKKLLADHTAELDRRNTERVQSDQRQRAQDAYRERAVAFAKTVPDFRSVVTSADDVMIPPHVEECIVGSEVGPALAYHLAKNPRTAERIAGLSPLAAAREIGKLEERLTPKKARLETKARPPIAVPKGASPAPTKDPAKMSFAEYDKWREAGDKS